jgi:hypothetical protein
MLSRRAVAAGLVLAGLALGGFVASARQSASEEDRQIRLAALDYYSSVVLGDPDACLKAVRLPLVSVRDGKVSIRDAASVRAVVSGIAKKTGVASLSADERKRIVGTMRKLFADADVSYLGGRTVTVQFLVRPGGKGEGDCLGELVLVNGEGGWKVVVEITDGKPAPAAPDIPELSQP